MNATMHRIRAMQFGFGTALAVLFVVGMAAYRSVIDTNESARWTQHTHEVLEHIAALRSGMASSESGYRDFAFSGDAASLQLARGSELSTDKELRILGALTA